MKKKRIVSGMLAVLAVFTCTSLKAGIVRGGDTCTSLVNNYGVSISANAADLISDDHFKYVIKSDNTIKITGYDFDGANGYTSLEPIGDTGTYQLTIPSELNDLPVNEISYNAFGKYDKLGEVFIPSSIQTIGNAAFKDCTSLSKVTLNNGLEKLGSKVFSGSVITSIDIPCTLTYGNSAFEGCANLSEINFLEPDEGQKPLNTIPDTLFANVTALKTITLPESVTSIQLSAFKNTGLTEIKLPEKITSIGSGAFSGTAITSIYIPSTLTKADKAFSGCASLAEVTFDENMYTIPAGLFNSCTALTEVTLPAKADTVGANAFANCTNLKKIVVPDGYCRMGTNATQKTPCTFYSYADVNADETAQTVQSFAAKSNNNFESLGDYAAPDPYYGDLNKDGSVDILDVITINKGILGKETLTWQQTERADVDKSNKGLKMDSNDSLNMLKYIVGIITDFEEVTK